MSRHDVKEGTTPSRHLSLSRLEVDGSDLAIADRPGQLGSAANYSIVALPCGDSRLLDQSHVGKYEVRIRSVWWL